MRTRAAITKGLPCLAGIIKKPALFDMAQRHGKFDHDAESATVPGLAADTSLGAPPTTRIAAALDYEKASVKMRRRRVKKSEAHKRRLVYYFVGAKKLSVPMVDTM